MIGQITLLSPTGDGGFETGTTFAANGWTVVNANRSSWEIGAGAGPYAGARGIYTIDNTAGTWAYFTTGARTSHIYRDIAIPAGASSITLSFYWKGKGESNWDRALVYTAPTTVTPAVNVPLSNTTAIAGATLVWTQPNVQPDPPTYTLATVPLPNALAGTTVRIIFTWQNDVSGGIAPGAAIDNIGLTYFAACAGLPNSGTAAITAASGCASANFTLSATGLTGGSGISYQWQSASSGTGPWSNIAGATTATYSTSATVNTFYRIVTTCANGGASANSTAVAYTISGDNCTCGPYPLNFATSTADEDITNVTIGAMNNSSACGALAPGAGSVAFRYGNYTGSVAGPNVVQGSSVPFSLTMTTCGGNFNNFFQIYVDWNQDGDFADAGEQVYSQAASVSGNQTVAGNFNVPLTALVGVTRMRIINIEAAASLTNYATSAYTFGETEDYCITVTAAAACSGTPSAGTSTISAASGCANTNFTLTGNGLTIGTGITYQWQSASTGAGPWSNIAGATSSTLNTTANTTTYFRLVTTCVNSGANNNTNSVSYTIVGDNCTCGLYPLNFATSTADEDITDVTVGGMNNSSVCGTTAPGLGSVASRYSNFTGSVAGPSVVQGSSVPFSLTMTTCGGSFSNFFQIYVDWNQDGDFADAGEQVYSQAASATGNQTVTGNFNVPGTALVGLTRMRIVNIEATASLTNYTNQNYTWGETEDYCITINAAAPCAGVPNAGTSTISINSGCPNTSFTLSASGLSFGIGTTYQWQSSGSALGPWSNIPAATSITLTTSATATTFYRILTTCSNGSTSNISNSVSYTINCNDIVCEAFTIACGQTLTGTTTNATLSGTGEGTACTITPTQPGVWYKVIGDGQNMTASLCGTAWDSRIQVFSGSDCNNLTCVGGNDNGGPACAGTSASFQWTSVVGVNYYILVSGAISNSTFNLSLTCETPPTNDLICNASSLTCGQTINGTTISASASGTGESQACGGFTQNQPGVWYSVVGSGQNINASLCASAWDSRIQVFTGSNCNSVTCIGGNDNDGPLCAGNAASFTWLAANATTYYILVSGVTNTSTFTLSVSCQTPCASACGAGAPPTNDACFGAQNLGAIPAPAACPNGVGAVVNFSGNNLCATAEANYTSLLGCTPAGNQASPAADVWYKFSITAPILNITLNGLTTPNIALYEGTNCLNLIPRGCAIGAAGLLTRQFQGLAPGTYYLQVSGGDVLDRCTFTISLQNNFDCSGCVLAADLNVTPAPINGQLQSNQLVTFCYTITSYQQTSANWLHGLVPSFGPGWDLTTFVPLGVTTTNGGGPNRCSSSGTWAYYPNSVTSTANGSVFPPGFYFETSSGNATGVVDGNPGNNFGDANPGNCSWTFCWQIRTKQLAECVQDAGLNVSINTTGDGESGSWTSLACNLDPEVNFFSQSNCCPIPSLLSSNITCAGASNGSATATGSGTSPWTYVWRNSAGDSIQTNIAVAGTSTLNNLAAGDYSVQVTDATACTSYLNFIITEPVLPNVTINSNPSSLCNGTSGTVIFNGPPGSIIGYNINNGPTQNITLNAAGAYNLNTGNLSVTTTYNLVNIVFGSCIYSANGFVTFSIQPNNTVGTPSSLPTLCVNAPMIPDITISTTGATGIGIPTGLPAGVTAIWTNNTIIISGTPTAVGIFNYSIPLTGGCGTANASGTITVNALPTITSNLVSYSTCAGPDAANASAPGITLSSPQAGTTFNWSLYAGNVVAGVPIQTGTGNPNYAFTNSSCSDLNFVYQVVPVGSNGCLGNPLILPVLVRPKPTSTFSVSANPVCSNQIVTVTYTGTACPGATYNWTWPTGVTVLSGSGAGPYTISFGSISTTVNYALRLQVVGPASLGSCTSTQTTINLVVNPIMTVGPSITAITCQNLSISTPIQINTTNATGISNAGVNGANGLPAGMSANWANNTITISGTPTAIGTFNFVIPLTGGCGTVNATGTITVVAPPIANLTSSTSLCPGSSSTINFTGTALATLAWSTSSGGSGNFVFNPSGVANIGPNSINAAWATWPAGTIITFYQVSINGCTTPINFVITVTSSINVNVTAQSPICSGSTSQLTFTGTPSATVTYNLGGGNLLTNTGASGTITVSSPIINNNTNVTVTLVQIAGGCNQVLSNSSPIVVSLPNNAGTPSTNPTLCINTTLTPITIATTGATGISNNGITGVNGLPAGVSAFWASNTITISGTPTAAGTFNYSIPLTGGCGSYSATGTIIVTPANTVGSASSSPSICANTALPNITHTTLGATSIGSPTNLPNGVTASWVSNTIIITGTPTVAGTFNYSIPLTGGCGGVSATGTIIVTNANTVGVASSSPTLCINTALTNITHTTTGATGIGVAAGLPSGVSATWASNTITISGTPTAAGTFNYSIPLTGGCGTVNATGTITVNPLNTTGAPSATPTICPNNLLTPITIATTGATGIGTVTGLPSGVSAAWNSNVITISGTPTIPGTYSYNIALIGGCGNVSASGSLTVSDILDFVNLQSPASGTICQNGTYNAYGQVYNVGDINTTLPGQAAGVTAQIGYSTTNSDPATWTNWSNASFNTQIGNNDEYIGTLSGLAAGTYYYAFRYQINGCAWQYGGLGGTWNGTTSNSGVMTVTAPPQAGNDGIVTLCATGTPVNLFTSLGALAATNGTWSGPSALTGGNLGTFNPLTNTPGAYTYTVIGGVCPNDFSLVNVSITNSPTATVTYPSPVCTNISTAVVPVITGSTGGTFSAIPSGMSLAANGGFVPSATTPNTYNVTYNIAASSGCAAFTTTTTVVVIAPPAAPILSPNPVCSGASTTFTATGGTWYEYLLNGTSTGAASAANSWTSGTLNGGDIVCVRSYAPATLSNNGSIENQWGSPIATNTGGPPSGFGANYINALYLSSTGGYLYGAIAGSLVNGSNNRILLFLDCISGGYNSLAGVSLTGSPYVSIENLNPGITFDPGFNADFILAMNVSGGIVYYDLFNLQTNTNYYLGSNSGAPGIVPSNLLGYSSASGPSDFSSGFEFAVPVSLLGNPSGSISTFTMLVNDPGLGNTTNTTLSNQFLTPAGSGDNNYGNGPVFFGSAAPNPIQYNLPSPCFSQSCISVTNSVSPIFTNPPPICQGQPAPTLPSSSNGVSGTWNPATVSNQNTAIYNFTPTTACGGSGSITVTVNPTPGTTLIFHE